MSSSFNMNLGWRRRLEEKVRGKEWKDKLGRDEQLKKMGEGKGERKRG